MMRSPSDIGIELRTRDCHIRQYLGMWRFDVWMDNRCQGSFMSPLEAEACVRNLLGITLEEGTMLDAYVARQRGKINSEMN